MIGIFVYIAFCWAVMKIGKPFHFAAVYVVGMGIIKLLFGGTFTDGFIEAVVGFLYYSAVFGLISRHADGIFLPVLISGIGLALPMLLMFFLSTL